MANLKENFLSLIFSRFGVLLLKLAGSRKSFYQLISKLIALHLILNLKIEQNIIIVFALTSISDFIYFGILTFEKVKLEYKKS